jgi:ABC-type phosphate/phosphonate transport system substrate-binding protein
MFRRQIPSPFLSGRILMKPFLNLLLMTTVIAGLFSTMAGADDKRPATLQLVVMDPLSAPLSCDCVKGYAQRKYEKLGEFLTIKLKRKVSVVWSESLEKALHEKTDGQADLVIGKHSVVLHDAKRANFPVVPIAALTDKKGKTTQSGWIVVRKDDPAKAVADLSGYRIFFGPEDCAEKYAAPISLLKKHGIELPKTIETQATCSTAAKALMELDSGIQAAAVISSYAEPLLAGCGTIKKGDLRVIGVSEDVPFITAFASQNLDVTVREALQAALLEVGEHAELLTALETGDGFIKVTVPKSVAQSESPEGDAGPAKKK